MHALIIEDECLIAMAIEGILARCGFTSFDFAATAEDAVQAAQANCPDLITADVELDPGSGIEAVSRICSGPPIPVIFITGTPAEAATRLPLHPIVVKPFTEDSVKAAVTVALSKNP